MSGSGKLISVGNDYIMGLRDRSILSRELVNCLRKEKILVLAHALKVLNYDATIGNWFDDKDLGLRGSLATEWDQYLKSLIGASVNLKDIPDQLLWT